MNIKDLIRTLKRFPKTAQVKLCGDQNPTVRAQVNELDEWTVIIDIAEKINEDSEKNPCINTNN